MPFKLALILSIAAAVFKDRADFVAENVALRRQLSCLIHRGPRTKNRAVDRVFWVPDRIYSSIHAPTPIQALGPRILFGMGDEGGGPIRTSSSMASGCSDLTRSFL